MKEKLIYLDSFNEILFLIVSFINASRFARKWCRKKKLDFRYLDRRIIHFHSESIQFVRIGKNLPETN